MKKLIVFVFFCVISNKICSAVFEPQAWEEATTKILKETSELASNIENITNIDGFKNIDLNLGIFNLNRIDAGRHKIFQDVKQERDKYEIAEKLINIFIQNDILKHRLFSLEDVYDQKKQTTKMLDLDDWTYQKDLLKSIIQYARDKKIDKDRT